MNHDPAEFVAEIEGTFQDSIHELGEIIQDSDNPDLIATVRKAKSDIARGNVTWHRVRLTDD